MCIDKKRKNTVIKILVSIKVTGCELKDLSFLQRKT